MSSTEQAQGTVTVLITRRVAPSHEAAFEHASEQMIAAARSFPGYLGGQLVNPEVEGGADATLYNLVLAFDAATHLQAWQESPVHSLALAAIAPHIEGQSVRHVSGLGHWFAAPAGPSKTRPRAGRWPWSPVC
jgi:antibiotic biosynthesis monooxygenase (ABM) superfamily enzyme